MEEMPPVESPSIRNHRRQRTWQILVPFLLMTGVIVAAAVLVVAGGVSQARLWADISTIWLLAPLLTFALLFLGILIGLIYGLAKLMQITPRYTGRAQDIAARVSAGTRKVADGMARPFVWLQQVGAAIEDLIKRL